MYLPFSKQILRLSEQTHAFISELVLRKFPLYVYTVCTRDATIYHVSRIVSF